MERKMFCYQCEQTAGCTACTGNAGVCGKRADTARLQDKLTGALIGLARATEGNEYLITGDTSRLVLEGLFTTVTNVNFNNDTITELIRRVEKERERLVPDCFVCTVSCGKNNNYDMNNLWEADEDVRSLKSLILFGIRGVAAYAYHAAVLGYTDDTINRFFFKALFAIGMDDWGMDELLPIVLEVGEINLKCMALLDRANTETYGNPEITTVDIGVGSNPGILVSGHDLRDMEMLLEQTQGTGVDVYTHSEMLPAQYYPAFKKYPNFKGNYGNAWWRQKEEFEMFNGPILMTTNCIVPPKDSYKDRLYTTGAAGYPGCTYINGGIGGKKDFSVIIQHAKRCEPPTGIEQGQIVGGFAHAQVLALADKVVDAVKSGKIRKFVVMAGCDGRAKSRTYYTDFAKALPEDTIILTAGCAKYRYNKLNLGDIEGIPRVLDAGQCNDSYSLAVIAMKLQEIFGLDDINDLPIIYNIAWYEQKAVIVLLALLSLGIKNIHLGPTLPAFLSPNVVNVLVEKFGIAGIDSVESDVELFFGEK